MDCRNTLQEGDLRRRIAFDSTNLEVLSNATQVRKKHLCEVDNYHSIYFLCITSIIYLFFCIYHLPTMYSYIIPFISTPRYLHRCNLHICLRIRQRRDIEREREKDRDREREREQYIFRYLADFLPLSGCRARVGRVGRSRKGQLVAGDSERVE